MLINRRIPQFTKTNTVVILALALALLLGGCNGKLSSKITSPPALGYVTSVHNDLISLPEPKGKISVAVYNFQDQTGQYKVQPNATSFSTAVTQGATSMLIQALIDSRWFVPVEREGLQNLLNERKITRSTQKSQSSSPKKTTSALSALTPAKVLIEGGIVAYESNLETGGFGARYFGTGGKVEYRTDRVTLYLRAVDIRTGNVLKSVSTSKSILSRGVDVGLFRFVRLKRLLEVETGLTTNEPPQMCILEAIEKAVHSLIIEGILDNLWQLKNADDFSVPALIRYKEEKGEVFSPSQKVSQ